MNILEMKNITFSYDNQKKVLENISITFEEGKIYGIFGKSGAGKTTLLSLLAGLENIKDGDIFYQGKSLKNKNTDYYRSHNIGIIFQSYNLLPYLTALENVILSIELNNSKVKNKKEKAYQLLKKVGLDEEKSNRRILQLSGGEQQRVAIARAISYDSKIILADEPTGNLDKETEYEIIELLSKLAHDDHKCVIIISHSGRVKHHTDIAYDLINGKLESNEK